jgi:hypothetical protein
MVGGVGGELLLRKPFAALLLLAPPAVLGLMVLLSVASIIPFMLGEEEGGEQRQGGREWQQGIGDEDCGRCAPANGAGQLKSESASLEA